MKIKLSRVAAVICLSFFLSACNKKATPPVSTGESKPEPKTNTMLQKSNLKNLLSAGKNLNCTYTTSDPDSKLQISGATYISNKKFASEVTTIDPTDSKKNLTSFMVSDGEYLYTWSPDKKTSGMKIKIELDTKNENNTKTDVAGAQESMEKEYEMQCLLWSVDESKFAIPEDVKFTDFSELMKGLPKMPSLPVLPK